MLKQAALHFIGEPAVGTQTEASDAGDLALGGTLARALDSIEDAAQQDDASARRSRRNPDTTECYSWLGPFGLLLKYSHLYNCSWANLVLAIMRNNGYVLIRYFRLSHA